MWHGSRAVDGAGVGLRCGTQLQGPLAVACSAGQVEVPLGPHAASPLGTACHLGVFCLHQECTGALVC